MVETIALFGGTGGTGSAFLKLALEAGYKVRALVRTPSKVSVGSNEHFLTVMQGSFDDTDKVEETIKGADYVVCMGGIPPSYVKGYPTDVMLNFVKKLYGLLERQTSAPKLFLYQSGATAAHGDGTSSFTQFFLHRVLFRLLGWYEIVCDNAAVGKYMFEEHNKESGTTKFPFIVTRPGHLNPGESKYTVKASETDYPFTSVPFVDLAAFTLKALKDESLYYTFPFAVR